MGNDFKKIIGQYVDEEIVKSISSLIESSDSSEIVKSANAVATTFGSSPEMFTQTNSELEEKLVSSFQKNLSLLIQKTWVEEEDADLKEQVLYKLAQLCEQVKKCEWSKSYLAFLQIIDDVVYLMFGSQTKKGEFMEYALRIDPEFGLFWYYAKALPVECDFDNDKSKVLILLGMYFLANY